MPLLSYAPPYFSPLLSKALITRSVRLIEGVLYMISAPGPASPFSTTRVICSFSAISRTTCSIFVVKSLSNKNRTRSEEHTSELQSLAYLVCRLLLEKKEQQEIDLHKKIHHP